jgi:hypothetical protein
MAGRAEVGLARWWRSGRLGVEAVGRERESNGGWGEGVETAGILGI